MCLGDTSLLGTSYGFLRQAVPLLSSFCIWCLSLGTCSDNRAVGLNCHQETGQISIQTHSRSQWSRASQRILLSFHSEVDYYTYLPYGSYLQDLSCSACTLQTVSGVFVDQLHRTGNGTDNSMNKSVPGFEDCGFNNEGG